MRIFCPWDILLWRYSVMGIFCISLFFSSQERETAQAPAVCAEQSGPGPHLGHPEVGGCPLPGHLKYSYKFK